jgi:dTDP-4-dehydrorhamnose reductase
MKSVTKMTPTQFSNLSNRVPSPVVIAGAGGMLGWDLARAFSDVVGAEKVHPLSRGELNISDRESVKNALDRFRPSVVLNAAAYTQVDRAEADRDAAHLANAVGPAVLAAECAARGIFLVHYSTDQVFDGSLNRPHREGDPVNPLNWYARTKYEGETEVLRHAGTLALRVQWLYGQRKDRFSPLKTKETFSPFSDQFGSPTWTREIATITAELLSSKATGLFHLSYDDYASWTEIFQFVKERWNLSLSLQPQSTAALNLPAKRPLFSVLSNEKISRTLGRPMGSWKTPLADFLSLL